MLTTHCMSETLERKEVVRIAAKVFGGKEISLLPLPGYLQPLAIKPFLDYPCPSIQLDKIMNVKPFLLFSIDKVNLKPCTVMASANGQLDRN